MLNEKQEKFCQNYVVYRNATEAAKQAGYSESSAYNQGYRLLQMEEVLERIKLKPQVLMLLKLRLLAIWKYWVKRK
jgi:phage terminase small subunit